MILPLALFLSASPCASNDAACWRGRYEATRIELVQTASTAALYFEASVRWEAAYDKLKSGKAVCDQALASQNDALNQCTARLQTQPTTVIRETPDWYWPVAGVAAGLAFGGGVAAGTQLCR